MPEQPRSILILGAGRFASEVADLISEIGGYEVTALVESRDRTKAGTSLDGFRILWLEDILPLMSTHTAVCALGTTHRDAFIREATGMGFRFSSIIHPTALISRTAEIGEGSILSRGSIVSAHVELGGHVIVNRGCLIGHHVTIGAFCTISPGANIAGGTRIEENVYIGMGAVILNGVRIGKCSVVGAGAVVTHDVPDHVQVIGIPARITKTDIEGL